MTKVDADDMRQMTSLGRQIERGSFDIVDAEAGAHGFAPEPWQVVRRVIHATADFEFKDIMEVSPNAIAAGVTALRAGCPVVVDVRMIEAGLNRDRLAAYGCRVINHISDEDVIEIAKRNNSTRAIEAMKKSATLGELDGAIVAIGNAPTALLEVARLIKAGDASPALIVGVPVGFVSAAESKEVARLAACPHIVSRGRKGGSPVAVAILHALLLLSAELPTEVSS